MSMRGRYTRRYPQGDASSVFARLVLLFIFLVGGLILSLHNTNAMATMTSTADATIIDFSTHHHRKRKKTWAVRVRFEDSDHIEYTSWSVSDWESAPAIGSHVEIMYDPRDPGAGFCQAIDKDINTSKSVVSIFGTIGLGAVLIVFVAMQRHRSRHPESAPLPWETEEETHALRARSMLSDNPEDFVSDGMSYGVPVDDGSDASRDDWDETHPMSL